MTIRHPARWPALLLAMTACNSRREAPPPAERMVPVISIGGFDGPEAVRYDPAQDVYFVSNFGGEGAGLSNDGFISRLRGDGTMDSLRFIAGGRGGVTLHMPRGMAIHGDTLWVADVDAVRGFHRVTGARLASVDFTSHRPGFLNDVTVGGDGAIYVTDTGAERIYSITGGRAVVVLEDRGLGGPNGITWDEAGGRFLIAPYSEGRGIFAWVPGGPLQSVAEGFGGKYDGVEIVGPESTLVASQADSTLHLFGATAGRPWIKLGGAPADIAWDAGRRLVVVPYVSRDTVEFFRLP